MINYCWSEVSGFSKFGSYSGNGSNSGPTITTGFKPTWVMVKRSDSTSYGWQIMDSNRGGNKRLFANLTTAEDTQSSLTFNNDGFTLTDDGTHWNASGGTYVYMAFADKPPGEIIDSLIDTPTNYDAASGNNGGNYCTWNPLQSSNATLSNGNLDCTTAVSSAAQTRGTMAFSSGKWYWEVLVNTTVVANNIGIIKTSQAFSADRPGYFADGYGYVGHSGSKETMARLPLMVRRMAQVM